MTSITRFFNYIPFGASDGSLASIPFTPPGGGEVSWPTAWGPNYAPGAGLYPEREVMNALFNLLCVELGNIQAVGFPQWADASLNGGSQYGYAANSIVQYAGINYVSLVNTNTATPGTDFTKWGYAATLKTFPGCYSGVQQVTTTPVTLVAANKGFLIEASASASSIIMPAIAGLNVGDSYTVVNYKAANITVSADGASTFTGVIGSTTAISIPQYCFAIITKETASSWSIVGLYTNNTISCKAWVSFNGMNGSVGINKAHNVASVTRLAAGRYQLTFTIPMADTNYCVVFGNNSGAAGKNGTIYSAGGFTTAPSDKTVNTLTVVFGDGTAADIYECDIAIFD